MTNCHSGSRTRCDDRLRTDAHHFYILNFHQIWYQINIIRLTSYLIWYQINIVFLSHLILDKLHSQAYVWYDIRSTSISISMIFYHLLTSFFLEWKSDQHRYQYQYQVYITINDLLTYFFLEWKYQIYITINDLLTSLSMIC